MRRVLQLLDEKLERVLICILFVAFTFLCSMEVFVRYVLNSPTDWSEELARYLFIYVVYVAAALAVKTGSHLRIDLVLLRLKPKIRIWFETFADVCFGICALLIINYSLSIMGLQLEMQTLAQSTTLIEYQFNMAYAYGAIPLGWSLVIIRLVQREIKMWRKYLHTGQIEEGIRYGD